MSMGFPREEYWSRLPCPFPGDLPDLGIEPASLMSPALTAMFFTTSTTREAPLIGKMDPVVAVCSLLFILSVTQEENIGVLPDVRIPEREERRLSRQCNSQKGKFITDSSQGFLPQPTQWCRVRKALSRRLKLLSKFIRYA